MPQGSSAVRPINGLYLLPSYVKESTLSLFLSLLLLMLSLKMCAKIVTESCTILFESTIQWGKISARHLKKNFAQNLGDFQCFGETNKFIATYMYTCLASNGAALQALSLWANSSSTQNYKVWTMLYNTQIYSSSCGLCPSSNRYINTKTLRSGSRLCFRLQARSN